MSKYRFQFICSSRWGVDYQVHGGGLPLGGRRMTIGSEDSETPAGYMAWEHFAGEELPVEIFEAYVAQARQKHCQWYENALRTAKDEIDRQIIEEVHQSWLAEQPHPKGIARWVGGREWEIVYQVPATSAAGG